LNSHSPLAIGLLELSSWLLVHQIGIFAKRTQTFYCIVLIHINRVPLQLNFWFFLSLVSTRFELELASLPQFRAELVVSMSLQPLLCHAGFEFRASIGVGVS
jgi:hypothetical protein